MISPGDILALDDPTAIASALNLSASPEEELLGVLDVGAELMQTDAVASGIVLGELSGEGEKRGNLDLAAEASYLHARTTMMLGRLPEALELIDRAAGLWVRDGEPLKAARTDLGRMNILDDLGRHQEAIEVGEGLVSKLDALGAAQGSASETVWMRAAALENIGVGRGYLGHHEAALAAYERAESVYQANGLEDEVARPMANRGVELVAMGRLEEAINTLRTAALEFDRQGDRLFAARCLAYEARAQMLLGNYVASAAASDGAAAFLGDQETTTDYARTQLVRAETLTSMNLHYQSLNLIDALVDQFAAAGLEHDLAAAHLIRAVALTELGQRHAANSSFIESEKRYESVADYAMAAVARLGRSELLDADEAAVLATSALSTLRSSGRPGDHAAAELRLSQLAASAEQALVHLDVAAGLLATHDLPHLRWKEQHERGRRLVERGDLQAARAAFEEALAGLDEMRRTVDQDLQRLPFMGGRDRVHRDLASVLLQLGDAAEAYQVSETARARTLVERMRGELIAVEVDAATAELDALYSELLQGRADRVESVRRAAREIESATGQPAATEATQRGTVDIASTVTYQFQGDEIMAFVAEGNSLRAVQGLTTAGNVASLMQRLDAQWRRFADPGLAARQHSHLIAATKDVLQQLHLALLGPLEVLSSESLMVVPVGLLANVPFAALHDGTCFLTERMPVVMAPSRLAAEHAAGRHRGGSSRLVLGVADERTPRVLDEVAAVASTDPGATVLTNDAATTAAFWDLIANHDIIHVASHAIERPDNPLFGAVRFADRWMTAAEVAGAALDGQLVVLSSCSSGRQFGARSDDELIGLPRAFLAAGASAVVVNLWQVEDDAATSLMTTFHSNLNAQPTAQALRLAQTNVMSTHPHPYRWAPSVLIGAPSFRQELP